MNIFYYIKNTHFYALNYFLINSILLITTTTTDFCKTGEKFYRGKHVFVI